MQQQQQQAGRRGDGCGGRGWEGILLVFRCCGRQAAPRRGSAGALLFLLPLLLFLDPRNSEQAVAGAALLPRREGDRKGRGGGMSVPLDVMCSAKRGEAAVQTRPHQAAPEPAWRAEWEKLGSGRCCWE